MSLMRRYALVICRNQMNRYLCVQERTKKWWIVGGKVEEKESFKQAAVREALEEAGIAVVLKGILTIDAVEFGFPALRVIFYAEP